MKSYLKAMRNYANFKGRATRSEFWLYGLVLCVLVAIAAIIDVQVIGDASEPGSGVGLATALVLLVHFLPTLAIQARRLHDSDKSGWWNLVSFVPLGSFLILGFCLAPSTPGRNRFDLDRDEAPNAAHLTSPIAASSSPTGASTLERLEKLASLKASGALDDAEFQKLKAEVLGQ